MALSVDRVISGSTRAPAGPDAREVAERAAGCSTVVRLSSGTFGEVATYLPGLRVPGVRVTPGALEVHVVSRWDVPVADVAAEVRAAVMPVARGLEVAVFIDDIQLPTLHQEGRQS